MPGSNTCALHCDGTSVIRDLFLCFFFPFSPTILSSPLASAIKFTLSPPRMKWLMSLPNALVGNSDFWFWFLRPPLEVEFWFCFRFRKFWLDFWNSDVWKVRKLEFRFAKFGIPIICLRRNSLGFFLANLYWLQRMYTDLILMIHELVAPWQHQTADLGGTTSCYLMASSMRVILLTCYPQ